MKAGFPACGGGPQAHRLLRLRGCLCAGLVQFVFRDTFSVLKQSGNSRASVSPEDICLRLVLALAVARTSWHTWRECHNLFSVKLSQRGKLLGGHERNGRYCVHRINTSSGDLKGTELRPLLSPPTPSPSEVNLSSCSVERCLHSKARLQLQSCLCIYLWLVFLRQSLKPR